jgi:hypothetical protein
VSKSKDPYIDPYSDFLYFRKALKAACSKKRQDNPHPLIKEQRRIAEKKKKPQLDLFK